MEGDWRSYACVGTNMPSSSSVIRQAGAIPIRGERICVVSSRGGKRWVVPKGCLEPGKSSAEIALQEAWEEAGLVGILQADPIGTYLYEKSGFTCHVTIFVMNVTEEAERWPERDFRQRCWLEVSDALKRIDDAGLRELIREAIFAQTRRGEGEPAASAAV
jgi:8-oxo-dGTP pyrophosphatase MutT (NUDIX family)